MIKFATEISGDRLLLGFGLSKANVRQLMKGNPIKVNLSELVADDTAMATDTVVLIFYGETEEKMAKNFAHLIGPGTKVVDRKKGVEN